MLVERIKTLSNIDVADGFSWTGKSLKKHNLIYGWNGSGKTTISRLFSFLENKQIYLPEFSSVQFSIECQDRIIKHQDIPSHTLQIKVFNEDFVRENLSFDSSSAKKILILGKDKVGAAGELAELEGQAAKKREEFSQLRSQQAKLPKLDTILTDAGSEVPKQFGNTPLATHEYYGRSYNKKKIDAHLQSGAITEANLASHVIDDPIVLDSKRELIKTDKKPLPEPHRIGDGLEDLFASANALLQIHVKTENNPALDRDKELRDWTETGHSLHLRRNAADCLFCNQPLPRGLLEAMSMYFTVELSRKREEIAQTARQLREIGTTPPGIDSSLLYSDLQQPYQVARKAFDESSHQIQEAIQKLISALEEKQNVLNDSTKAIHALPYPHEAVANAKRSTDEIWRIVTAHNVRVSAGKSEVEVAAKAIEFHTIASLLRAREYFPKKAEASAIASSISALTSSVEVLDTQIKEKRASIHNIGIAIDKINSVLADFWGKDYIYLESETTADDVGYVVKRRQKRTKHLSEAERSVIALVYFLAKLEEDGCDKENCLVVIDDPIDSQDGIFLFRTFAYIKRQIRNVGQTILLTHNYDFFNLCRDWFNEKALEDDHCMLKIAVVKHSDQRHIAVEDLPALLSEHKNEYQYLFSYLLRYSEDPNTIDSPIIPNIARKILEYFAAFKWSCRSSEQFTNIVLTRFVNDQDHLKQGVGDFVVKFLHEYSHGQDFSREITATMLEAPEVAAKVLNFIRLADGDHYKALTKCCRKEAFE